MCQGHKDYPPDVWPISALCRIVNIVEWLKSLVGLVPLFIKWHSHNGWPNSCSFSREKAATVGPMIVKRIVPLYAQGLYFMLLQHSL